MLKGSEGRKRRGSAAAQKCVWGGGEGVTEETKSERGRSVNENLRPKSGNEITTGTNRRSGGRGGRGNELLPRERNY